jgi:hypothetical protein
MVLEVKTKVRVQIKEPPNLDFRINPLCGEPGISDVISRKFVTLHWDGFMGSWECCGRRAEEEILSASGTPWIYA